MDYIIELLISYGYWGMLIVAFIAGSFFPFSSEAVMTGLLAAGLDPWGLIIYGTIGNVAGGMFNYFVGRMGKIEWIEKYLHVKQKLMRANIPISITSITIGKFLRYVILIYGVNLLL